MPGYFVKYCPSSPHPWWVCYGIPKSNRPWFMVGMFDSMDQSEDELDALQSRISY